MRTLWLAPLLLCCILSVANAAPEGCLSYKIQTNECYSCDNGYLLYNKACVPTATPEGCLAYWIQGRECSSCDNGYVLYNKTCKKVKPAPEGCLAYWIQGDECSSCDKGYVLYSKTCVKCDTGCDACRVTQVQGNQKWTECTGSCQSACTKCNKADWTCQEVPKGYTIWKGQCRSCGSSCDKCNVITNIPDGYRWNDCIGYCGGGCNSCGSDGVTCRSCNQGYLLYQGKCWPCNAGCKSCSFAFYDIYKTELLTKCNDAPAPIIISVTDQPPSKPTEPTTPTPTPTQTDTGLYNSNVPTVTNSNNNSNASQSFLFVAGFVVILVVIIFIITKKKKENQRTLLQHDYVQAMAAEKQRQAALNIPTPNYQYQPPQGYPQGYPQNYNQGYPQGNQPRY